MNIRWLISNNTTVQPWSILWLSFGLVHDVGPLKSAT